MSKLIQSARFLSSFQRFNIRLNSTTIYVHWKKKSGESITTSANVGENIMRLAHRHGIELEGACEGVCACSTCHVILEDKVYKNLPEPSEDEEDMLDQAPGMSIILTSKYNSTPSILLFLYYLCLSLTPFKKLGLTPTSRLGCQVVLESKHDGIVVSLPGMTRNFYVVSILV